ncbi:MAG: DUF169 domain-containing protein [Desulfamplus sp.]
MKSEIYQKLPKFIDILGLDEEPMGFYFTDKAPEAGFSPDPLDLPTREKEIKNEINWGAVFGGFSCVIGNIWRARRKKTSAFFSAEQFGCPGGAFWLGFMKPQTETIIHYVSSGVPEQMEGEFYCGSPDVLRDVFETIYPPSAPKPFCVFKPISQFLADEEPLLVSFFTRAEPLCGLHQLAFFVTNDPEVVQSPWGAACSSLVTWPMKYLKNNQTKAVLGGWDISARKFFANDELSFTVPYVMFEQMIIKCEDSFLAKKNWSVVKKKIERSKNAWKR